MKKRKNIRIPFNRSFKEEGVIIRKSKEDANTKYYISEIKKGDIHFIGFLDSNIVKQSYGFMSLPNKEKIFWCLYR